MWSKRRPTTSAVVVGLALLGLSLVGVASLVWLSSLSVRRFCDTVEAGANIDDVRISARAIGLEGNNNPRREVLGARCGLQLCFCVVEHSRNRVLQARFVRE